MTTKPSHDMTRLEHQSDKHMGEDDEASAASNDSSTDDGESSWLVLKSVASRHERSINRLELSE